MLQSKSTNIIHYEPLRYISSGTFGSVYKVKNSNGDIYASKQIPKKIITNDKIYDNSWKIKKEIAIWHQLQDIENVCKLEDVYEDTNYIYLVQEYCENGPIHENMNSLTIQNIKAHCASILRFLVACHQRNILYGDIKPHNVLLTQNASQLRIIDFGCSRMLDLNNSSFGFCGTPLFCAPEVWQNTLTPKADCWAFGVLLYFLLSGYFPFWKESFESHICKMTLPQIKKDVIDMSLLENPLIPYSAMDLIRLLLEKDHKVRLSAEKALDHPWFNQ